MNQFEAITEPTQTPKRKKWRRALPWWSQIAILLVIFAAGAVVGAMIATKSIHSKMQMYRENAPIFAEDIAMRLRLRLNLNDDQAKQVREIVERRHPRMIEYRRQGAQAMHNEFDRMEEEIAGVLDEFQIQQWHEIAGFVRQRFLPPTVSEQQP